jgi:hypothetical protein
MRDLKLIKRCLILLALVWAQIPASVLAELCQPKQTCSMPCCVALAAKPETTPEASCKKCPKESERSALATRVEANLRHSTSISAHPTKDSCHCKISQRTSPSEDSNTVGATNSNRVDQTFDACPLSEEFGLPVIAPIVSMAGIVGTDSGPPPHRPTCVWLGRAPPMFVA